MDLEGCSSDSTLVVNEASQKGKQFWEIGAGDVPMPVSVKGRLRDIS